MLGVPCRMFLFALTTGKASHESNTQKAWRAGKSVRKDVQAGCCVDHSTLPDAPCGDVGTSTYRPRNSLYVNL